MKFVDLDQYNYKLPPELIRTTPLEPRDSARLFVYDTATDTSTFDTVRNLALYVPSDSLMVLNDTRVQPARLWLKKVTGGKIEVLVLVNEWNGKGLIPALVDRKVAMGEVLFFPDGSQLIAQEQQAQKFFFTLESQERLEALLDTYGTTPIPHYLEGKEQPDESLLRKRYQTIFAAAGASVAAPTASLHLTPAVFATLKAKGIVTTPLTLNVGLGTFAPLREENFQTGKLHGEYVVLSTTARDELERAKKSSKRIVSVGTTVTRSLEALGKSGELVAGSRLVDLFITPPYQFQMVDILMTNFHLPKTSLMLLVEAFLRHKGAKRGVVALYTEAIRERFTFYSFGDSLLIL